MIAGDGDDDSARQTQPRDSGLPQLDRFDRGNGAIEQIAGDDDGIDMVLFGDLDDRVDHGALFVEQ